MTTYRSNYWRPSRKLTAETAKLSQILKYAEALYAPEPEALEVWRLFLHRFYGLTKTAKILDPRKIRIKAEGTSVTFEYLSDRALDKLLDCDSFIDHLSKTRNIKFVKKLEGVSRLSE